jgi:hypothetical protein
MRHAAALAVACALAMPACTYLSGNTFVLVTSTPPGAEILVDGEPTGLTTPARLDLNGITGDDRVITLKLEGHDPETRKVVYHRTTGFSRWIDASDDLVIGFTFPIFWTLPDFFLPFKLNWANTPDALHAKLYKTGEGPVHGDVETP